ncbi:MAG: hypothetical protein AAF721_21625 [Myxococcota bacterium]
MTGGVFSRISGCVVLVATACGDDGGTSAASGDAGGSHGSETGVSPTGGAVTGGGPTGGDAVLDSSGAADSNCPPCVPPPDESCVGMGPCGCGPYVCEGMFEGEPGTELAEVACLACTCRLALDDTSVFVLDDVGLARVDKAGGALESIYSGAGAAGFDPRDLGAGDGAVIVAEMPGLTRLGADGTPMGTLGALDDPTRIAVAGDFVFFGRGGTGALHRVALGRVDDGGEVGGGEFATFGDVAVLGDTVVFGADNGVHLLPDAQAATPGAVTTLADGVGPAQSPNALAVDGDRVAFLRGDGSIGLVALRGGAPTFVEGVAATAVDAADGSAYFVEANAVRRVPLEGGRPVVHAAFGIATSPAIAVDETSVYWVGCPTDADGSVATLRSIAR